MEEEEEEDVAKEEDNLVNLNNDKVGALSGSEHRIGGAHLTFPNVDMEILLQRRNVMSFGHSNLKILSSKEQCLCLLAPL